MRAAWACLGLTLTLTLISAPTARAALIYSYQAQPPRALAAPRAPAGPPLGSGPQPGGSEETAGVPSAEGDQLVENGLSSPLCKGVSRGLLSGAAQSNCQTSGFVGAPAPTNNYALDVHIDVGALGLSKGELLSVIQDVFVAPVWNAIVWATHALVVMLEWCYTLELLNGSTMSGLAHSLRQAQSGFTEPWLPLVLAFASMLALYNGLVRRRIADTLGQALLTIVMMAAGLWVIADPLGTVGAVGQWANQASLGTLGAVAQGTPSDASRTLGDSMRAVFATAIEMPWCYLEFGNVRWCSDPALLEPRLRKAAVGLLNSSAPTARNAEALVGEADTNGKLFLAFPANGPERNSVKEAGSLLRVLCQAEDDTKCKGPAAAEAEFRSDAGTFPRMIGVVLVAIGALGMALLFGLLAMHLLVSAVAALFMLLLAPLAVLAPALGDGGRAVFGGWATRLLGAVTSKLVFSFLLGALLTTQRVLMSLQGLGWWTQWLLVSAFWWAVFLKRHQAVAFLHNRGRAPAAPARQSVARRVERSLQTPRAALRQALWAKRKLLSPAPTDERTSEPPRSDERGDAKLSVSGRRAEAGASRESRSQDDTHAPSPSQGRHHEPQPPPARHAGDSHEQAEYPVGDLFAAPSPADARAQPKSPIMDDARAVAEGRKRQLGYGPDR